MTPGDGKAPVHRMIRRHDGSLSLDFRRARTIVRVESRTITGCSMNSAVALNTSHGTSAANRAGGVRSRSQAPMPPPSKLGPANPIAQRRAPESSSRYPHMLLTAPGQSATVLVALATTAICRGR